MTCLFSVIRSDSNLQSRLEIRNHAIHKFFRKYAGAKTLDGRKAIAPHQVQFGICVLLLLFFFHVRGMLLQKNE